MKWGKNRLLFERIVHSMSRWWVAWYGGPLLMALVFCVVSYHFASSEGHADWEKKIMASRPMETINKRLSRGYEETKDVVFVDVSYNKMLVPIADTSECLDSSRCGVITNRQELLNLLSVLSEETNYKAIILDVCFDANLPTNADSALTSLLLKLPRVVISDTLRNCRLLDSRLENIAGSTVFPISVSEANFIKYPLWNKDKKSLPLLLYEITTDRRMRHLFGSLYIDGCSLACGNLFPILYEQYENDNSFYYLGNDEYDMIDFKDKFVVIGAISSGEDNHGTYKGIISGAEINLNTYFAMLHGQHRINIITCLLVLGFYYLLSYSIVRNRWKLTNQMQNSQLWPVRAAGLILSAFIYTILLGLLFVVNYLIFNQVLTFISVAVGFLIINKIIVTH